MNVIYIPVKCFDIIDNIVFMITGLLKCEQCETDKKLITEEIFDVKIYEQRYIYEPTIEYDETDCEALKELIANRIKEGFYNFALIERYSAQFTNPFKN